MVCAHLDCVGKRAAKSGFKRRSEQIEHVRTVHGGTLEAFESCGVVYTCTAQNRRDRPAAEKLEQAQAQEKENKRKRAAEKEKEKENKRQRAAEKAVLAKEAKEAKAVEKAAKAVEKAEKKRLRDEDPSDFSSKFGKQERENPEDLRIRLQGGQVNLFYCILLSHELHIVV